MDLLREKHCTDRVWAVSKDGNSSKVWGCQYLQVCVISQANAWEEYSSYFGEGMGISRKRTTTHFLTFMVNLGTVLALVGVPLNLLMSYTMSAYWGSRSSGGQFICHLAPILF